MWRAMLLAVLLTASAGRTIASAVEVDGASFPARVELPDTQLPLRGAGTLRYGLFWRVYTAALYAAPGDPGSLLDPANARRLEIVYFVDIPRQQIAEFAERLLREQLGDAAWQRLAPRVRAWHTGFRDARAGDRYAMQYDTGVLSLWLNGERLAQVADAELATAYFGLWLGERPIDRGLRRDLLGSDRPLDG